MLRAIRHVVEHLSRGGMPPLAPALAAAPTAPQPAAAPGAGYSMEQMQEDMRVLLGVPKYRTSKPKKQTRKFAYTRLLSPETDLSECGRCGTLHQRGTICPGCYEKVRELTNAIKEKMMAYNPYKGQLPNKEVVVKFSDELEEGVIGDKRVVEMDRPRPSWFKKL